MISHFGSESNRFMWTPKPPHFFKIILEHSLRDAKLGVPIEFLKKYRNDLSNQAVLKVPSGEVWQVELSKCDGRLWFQKGWKEFAEHYSLCEGHFLVFRYEGNCNFHVLIFDRSASEIEYPCAKADEKQSESGLGADSDVKFQDLNAEEDEEHDVSVEILEDIDDVSVEILDTAPCKKRREKSPVQCPRSQKMIKTNMTNKTDNLLKFEGHMKLDKPRGSTSTSSEQDDHDGKLKSTSSEQDDHGGLQPSKRGGAGMENGLKSPEVDILGFKSLTAKEQQETLRIADAFNSKNPFFLVVIQPSHISHLRRMGIPNNFARKYLPKRHGGGEAILCLSDRKYWPIKYFRRDSNGNPQAQLTTGWKKFALDNNLALGDICLFELLKGPAISLKIAIHRVVDDGDDPLHETTNRFDSTVPFFKRVVKPSYLNDSRVGIPLEFVEKYLKPGTSNVTLQVGKRFWSVKLTIYPNRREGRFAFGWKKFAQENSLRIGDVCVFELISSNDALLNVSISRKAG